MLVHAVGQQNFSWQKLIEENCQIPSCWRLPKCMIFKDSEQWQILPQILLLIYRFRFLFSQGGEKKKK